MKMNESASFENKELLLEIAGLKTEIDELYKQTGPVSSEYITLSIKLDLLIKEYIEEKIVHL